MTYFLALLNDVIVPFFAGLAVPVFAVALIIFVTVLILRKGDIGRAWYIIGIPFAFYILLGLLWMLANIVGGASSVPDDDLLPSATQEEENPFER
jgi:hypothetical protein